MTSPGNVRVDPEQVRAAGLSVQALGSALSGALGGREGDVAPGGVGDGWRSWGVMTRVGRTWVDELAAVAREVGDLGRRLVEAADHYRDTDERNAEAFRDAHPQ